MLNIFVNAWKVKELRQKILYTFMILAIIRLGTYIIIPGFDVASYKLSQSVGGMGTLYSLIAGGANSQNSIFAMGIGPYITSSIIMQLLTVAIPKLEQLSKEGQDGRKKIQNYSRYLTVVLAIIQGSGTVYSFRNYMLSDNILMYAVAVMSLICGTTFIMWLAEAITAKGISNGSSMIIFINIISSLPATISALYLQASGVGGAEYFKFIAVIVILLLMLALIILLNQGERRIQVQYSSKGQGRTTFGGNSSFMPIKVSTAGVMSIIFSLSLLQFPEVVSAFVTPTGFMVDVINNLKLETPIGATLYVLLIIFFTYFYTSMVINPVEIAESMKKNGGFIPGIRPGKPTSDYITNVVEKMTFVGAFAYAFIALIPIALQWIFNYNVGFGGTTLIIVVGVALDIVKSLDSQLLVRHYKGILS